MDYLSATLSGVLQAKDVLVFSDSIEPPPVPAGVQVLTRTPDELAFVKGQAAVGTYNFMRAIDWVAQAPDGWGCVFEDDVRFTTDWVEKLSHLVQAADLSYAKRWVLSLIYFYQPSDFSNYQDTPCGVQLTRWRNPEIFYGAQGLAFPASVAGEFGQMLRRARASSIESIRFDWFGDYAVKAFCRYTRTPLLACHPCLIQHVGDVSTFAANRPLATQYFQP